MFRKENDAYSYGFLGCYTFYKHMLYICYYYHMHKLHAFIIVDLSYENLECCDIFVHSNVIANKKFYKHK